MNKLLFLFIAVFASISTVTHGMWKKNLHQTLLTKFNAQLKNEINICKKGNQIISIKTSLGNVEQYFVIKPSNILYRMKKRNADHFIASLKWILATQKSDYIEREKTIHLLDEVQKTLPFKWLKKNASEKMKKAYELLKEIKNLPIH